MGSILQLSEARKNLSELVNEAYYQGKLFGISKGKKPMGVFIGTKQWKEIIDTIEMHDQGLADTLAITADPELQNILKEGEKDIKTGRLIPLDEV
jgi:PHD/YefM family antitoxin component YafN of YafNO toxin-antitoxin module